MKSYLEAIDKLQADQMNEERARKILGDWIQEDDGLLGKGFMGATCVGWLNKRPVAWMRGEFTPDQLKAIAWWMENKE